ncbi:DUF2569 domain-containing protein [Novosphingobium sp. Gsoil 351]|uniref:DUF2569 domain-containing protein n=1 Tax=Novosphingobium sp. Gsoil 351 TaxID=2675225 RepID=UPI001E4DDF88|nr:DUF2569 domain-containing protein [Novosphingobium sp. Gsoil 351]
MARFLESRMETIAVAWVAVFALGCLPRVLFPVTPIAGLGGWLSLVAPYALVALAPVAGFLIAAGSFPRGILAAQPKLRLSIYGRWRRLGILEARRSPVFGPAGFMASLLIGLLLNVVVRSFEFLLAMPAMGSTAPLWGDRLFALMAGDVIAMSFVYMVCFVMALRSIPLFPRMLLFAWTLDIAIQLGIARTIAATPGVPTDVTVPLHGLLEGNITKVLISAVIWLPYLILSDRVNVTYRWRAPH